jgi:hypothetical protein
MRALSFREKVSARFKFRIAEHGVTEKLEEHAVSMKPSAQEALFAI